MGDQGGSSADPSGAVDTGPARCRPRIAALSPAVLAVFSSL
jgi:hypothetical protein